MPPCLHSAPQRQTDTHDALLIDPWVCAAMQVFVRVRPINETEAADGKGVGRASLGGVLKPVSCTSLES